MNRWLPPASNFVAPSVASIHDAAHVKHEVPLFVIALLQRVSVASVYVTGDCVAAISNGLVVFVGVERGDSEPSAARLCERILGYRVFSDAAGKMNRNVRDVGGEVLLVPQFTLAADTTTGMRASFATAAAPTDGRRLFDALVAHARDAGVRVATGVFGADMSVTLTNEGPVTFWIET